MDGNASAVGGSLATQPSAAALDDDAAVEASAEAALKGGGVDIALVAHFVVAAHLIIALLITTKGNINDAKRNRSRLLATFALTCVCLGDAGAFVFEMRDLGHSGFVRNATPELAFPLIALALSVVYPPHMEIPAGSYFLGMLAGRGMLYLGAWIGIYRSAVPRAIGRLVSVSALLRCGYVGFKAKRRPTMVAAAAGVVVTVASPTGWAGSGQVLTTITSCLIVAGLTWPWLRGTDDRVKLEFSDPAAMTYVDARGRPRMATSDGGAALELGHVARGGSVATVAVNDLRSVFARPRPAGPDRAD